MANPDHLRILKLGAREWNGWRRKNPGIKPNISHEVFEELDLRGADLSGVIASYAWLSGQDLRDAKFISANLEYARFRNSDLSYSNLESANLLCAEFVSARLTNANLAHAKLVQSDFNYATLDSAFLCYADLSLSSLACADLRRANLIGARLKSANLSDANLRDTLLNEADLTDSILKSTDLANSSLINASGIEHVRHYGPSFVPTSALVAWRGQMPDAFLRGCGLSEWEILSAKLHDPTLSVESVSEIQQRVFDERMKGFFLCGVFVSYSRMNDAFADRIYDNLKRVKANAWLDRHDLVAGPLTKQIDKAIRINDVVLLVLSEFSVKSDWVKWELDRAKRVKEESGREILCPVALDDSWKAAVESHPRWQVLTDYNILDFSQWEDSAAFDTQFAKLFDGIKRYYATDSPETADA